ncbi:MAG: hypothetical protein ACLGG0_13710 [Bacteriovoracia bacterium]
MKIVKFGSVIVLVFLVVSNAHTQVDSDVSLNSPIHNPSLYGLSNVANQNQDVGWGVRIPGTTPTVSGFNSSEVQTGLSLPVRMGQSGIRNGMNNLMNMMRQGRESMFRRRIGNTSVGESTLNSARLNARLESYCAHLVANKPDTERPEGCSHDGTNALDNCDLGSLITENEIIRLKRVLTSGGANSKENCVARFKELSNITLSVAGHLTQATIQAATEWTELEPEAHTATAAGCALDGGQSPASNDQKLEECNDFNNTPFAGANMGSLMSKFINDFDGFGNFWKIIKLRGTTGECEACFADKYKTIQQASNLPADNFSAEYSKKLADSKVNLRVRKAEQALSEYIKFQERNIFMSRFLSAQPETCGNVPELSRLVRGCDPEQAKQVLEKIAQKHGVRAPTTDLPMFVNQLRSIHMSKLQAPVATPECGEGVRVTHTNYLATYQTQISTTPMQPSMLFTSTTKADLQRCGEYDQKCMLDAMTKALHAQKGGLEADSRKLVQSFFRQPFYRTLLTNRQSLLDYADSGDVTEANNLSQYKEANKDRFAEIARRDAEVACKSFGQDFMMALCVPEGDLAESYSGQGIKQELADMLASQSSGLTPGDAGKNLVNLTVACNMMNSAGNLTSEIHESEAISDKSFDRLDLADSFLRNNMREPSRLSNKKQAFFEKYAEKMCDDAVEEKRVADREAMLANQSPVTVPSNSSMFCYSKILLPGIPCPVDVFTNVVNNFDLFNFKTSPDYTNPPTQNLSQLGSNKKNPPLFPGSSYDANSLELDYFGIRGDESARYDSGFKTTGSVAPTKESKGSKDFTSGSATTGSAEVAEGEPVQNSFLQSATQMAAQLNAGSQTNQMAVVPSWTMPIPETTAASRGIASVTEDEEEESGSGDRRRSASERSIQEIEARQSVVEQQVLAQARETQTIQDLKNQAQIEQLRIELQKLQLSNKQLMTNIQRLSAPRKTQSEENMFDQDFVEDEVEETFEESEPTPTRPVARAVAQTNLVKPEGSTVARSAIDSSTVTSTSTRLPEQSKVDRPAATTSTAAVAANVGAARGGTQAAASRGVAASSGISFVPSMSLQRTITSEATQEVIPQEKKIELLKEFLSYVEKNPEYKDGRYLSSENDRVTIEYEGRTVILSVTDIQDNKARSHLQERLLRQRMVINQYVRASRLENLKRLLASTRAQQ